MRNHEVLESTYSNGNPTIFVLLNIHYKIYIQFLLLPMYSVNQISKYLLYFQKGGIPKQL